VTGNVPPSAGLSSSSALVSAAALAAAHANTVCMSCLLLYRKYLNTVYLKSEGYGFDS
jgi:galactokinase